MIRITVSRPGNPDQAFVFEQSEITIGRSSSCQLTLNEPGVSGTHARVTATGNGCVINDERSTNGTYLNGQPVQGPTLINPGDEIYIGMFRLGITQQSDVIHAPPNLQGAPWPNGGNPPSQPGSANWPAQSSGANAWGSMSPPNKGWEDAAVLSTITPPSFAASAAPDNISVPPPSAFRPTNLPQHPGPLGSSNGPVTVHGRSGSTGTMPPPALLDLPHPLSSTPAAAANPSAPTSAPIFVAAPSAAIPAEKARGLSFPPAFSAELIVEAKRPTLESPASQPVRPVDGALAFPPILQATPPVEVAGPAHAQSLLALDVTTVETLSTTRTIERAVIHLDLLVPGDPLTALCEAETADPTRRLQTRLFGALAQLYWPPEHAGRWPTDDAKSRGQIQEQALAAVQACPWAQGLDGQSIVAHALDEICSVGPLRPLLDDPQVQAIEVVGAQKLQVCRNGQWQVSPNSFSHPLAVEVAVRRLCGFALEPSCPHLHLALPNGWTLRASGREAAAEGPLLWLTRSRQVAVNLANLVDDRVLTSASATFSRFALTARSSLLVAHAHDLDEPLLSAAFLQELAASGRVALIRSRRDLGLRGVPVFDAGDSPERMDAFLRLAAEIGVDWVIVHEPLKGSLTQTWPLLRRAGIGVIISVRAERIEVACAQLDALLKAHPERGAASLGWLSLAYNVGKNANGQPRLREIAEIYASPLQPAPQVRPLASSTGQDEAVLQREVVLALATRWQQAGVPVDLAALTSALS